MRAHFRVQHCHPLISLLGQGKFFLSAALSLSLSPSLADFPFHFYTSLNIVAPFDESCSAAQSLCHKAAEVGRAPPQSIDCGLAIVSSRSAAMNRLEPSATLGRRRTRSRQMHTYKVTMARYDFRS